MASLLLVCRCLSYAVAKNGLKCLVQAIPLGGALWDVANDFLAEYRKAARQDADRLLTVLAQMMQAPPEEVRAVCRQAADEAARDQPPEVRERLAAYLCQVPVALRAALRRPEDPSGRTVPSGLVLRRGEDLVPLLPDRLPRFQPGQHPLPGADRELIELLGVGGFGEVWTARNPHRPALPPVVLKFCLDQEGARALRNEMRLLERILARPDDPAFAERLRQVGIVPLRETYLDAPTPCLEYEYIAGGDLTGLIREWHGGGSKPTPVQAARVVLRLAEIVGHAHGMGIVHRDLKPANILVQRRGDGGVKFWVTDFGSGGVAARRALGRASSVSAGQTGSRSDQTLALRGGLTPLYASPQQQRGDKPDPRDDVYALGVVWRQVITGELDIGGAGGEKLLQEQRRLGDPRLVSLMAACLEPRAEDRLQDAADLARRLRELLPAGVDRRKVIAGVAISAAMAAVGVPLIWVFRGEKGGGVPGPKPGDSGGVRGGGGNGLGSAPPGPGSAKPVAQGAINSIGMQLVAIPPGVFRMGSPEGEQDRYSDEGPQHEVAITRPFWLGVYPVTQREYREVMGDNPSWFCAQGGGKGKVEGLDTSEFPVEQVSWEEAVEFCRKLSDRSAEKEAGRVYRLPTEAEWEYACRGGAKEYQVFHFGNSLSSSLANFDGNYPYGGADKGPYLERTCKVGSYQANGFGLYDMHGNVWEWCADWFDAGYYAVSPREDPAGPSQGSDRVFRGGSWRDDGLYCRSADRSGYGPTYRYYALGFRVASVPSGR